MSLRARMGDSSTPEASSIFSSSVCSVLGVKSLRFRPHGSNQKAHVILRRVTPTEDSDNQGDSPCVARFSLFAQKRIEVKPGKELLLTVASEDGTLCDLPVVFEGSYAAAQADQQLTVDETQSPLSSSVAQTIPPKMRRAWTKKLEVSPSVEDLSSPPPTIHSSIGVQVRPSYVHTSIQTQSTDYPILTRTESKDNLDHFVEPDPLPSTSGKLFAVQSSRPRRYVSLEVQTDPNSRSEGSAASASRWVDTSGATSASRPSQEREADRSLTPMEIDSGPSSCATPPPLHLPPACADGATSEAATCLYPTPTPLSLVMSGNEARLETKVSDSVAGLSDESSCQMLQRRSFDGVKMLPIAPGPVSLPASLCSGTDTSSQSCSHPPPDVSRKPMFMNTPPSATSVLPDPTFVGSSCSMGEDVNQNIVRPPRVVSLNLTSTSRSLSKHPHPYSNDAQSASGSTHFSSNAVASSSRVTLDVASTVPGNTGVGMVPSTKTLKRSSDVIDDSLNVLGSSPKISRHDETPRVGLQPEHDSPAGPAFDGSGSINNFGETIQASRSGVLENPTGVLSTSTAKHPSQGHDFIPAETEGATMSWLSPFDDRCWDADAVPGLTASSSKNSPRKMSLDSLTLTDNVPLVLNSANDEKGRRLSQKSLTSADLLGTGLPERVQTVSPQLVRTEALTNGTMNQKMVPSKMPMGQSLLEVSTSDSLIGPHATASLTSVGPRGIKRERPSSPQEENLLSDASISVSTSNGIPEDKSPSNGNRPYPWPVFKRDYSANLSGTGDLAVRAISISSNGTHFALSCADKTLRIWDNVKRAEIARFAHNSLIVNVNWTEGNVGVITLGEDGIVGKWTRVGENFWKWTKIVDAGNEKGCEDKTCMAYNKDRIAVSFPKGGVKVWIWLKGTWQAQRSIVRLNVTTIKFVEDGAALLGGTSDGVLWYCEIPNGTLRAYSFLHKTITSLDMSPSGSHVLVGQVGGRARLVSTRQSGNRGAVEVSYSLKEQVQQLSDAHLKCPGAVFASAGQAVIFGSLEGCVLVWDKSKATISYGLEHDKDDIVQAVSCIDGVGNQEGWLITGTQKGALSWWTQAMESQLSGQKRIRVR